MEVFLACLHHYVRLELNSTGVPEDWDIKITVLDANGQPVEHYWCFRYLLFSRAGQIKHRVYSDRKSSIDPNSWQGIRTDWFGSWRDWHGMLDMIMSRTRL